MYKRLLLICFSLLLTIELSAQTKSSNELKYNNFRNKLKKELLIYSGNGMDKGTHIPMERKYVANGKKVAYWADGVWWQGHYLSVLATEYRRLQLEGKNTDATLNELKAALDVYDRLDLEAELCWGVDTFTQLNGFYIRDDIADGEAYRLKADVIQGDYHYHCGKLNKHNAPSQDQAWGTYLGLALIQKLVDDSTIFQHTVDIARRMVRGMQYIDAKGKTHWQVMNPVTGDIVQKEGDIQWLQYAHGTVGTILTGEDMHFGKSGKNNWKNIWEILQDNVLIDRDGHFTWYGVLALSAVMNDGGTRNCYDWMVSKCEKIAKRRPDLQQSIMFPHLPLINVVLYGYNGKSLIARERYDEYLNTAPESGAGTTEVAGEIVRTPAPWNSLSLFCPWHNKETGEFNMLDYMLLYNLVSLVYDYEYK